MRILFVSVEVAPFAKVGGLADVASSLPKALRQLGHDARVVMPLYRMVEDDPRWTIIDTVEEFDVDINSNWTKKACFKETELDGLPVGFIGTDEWFGDAVDNRTIYQQGCSQYLFFCKAVLAVMEELDWIPDVIHCNDWHTGFLPVLMREKAAPVWDQVACVYTIHNLAFQGEFPIDTLDTVGLERCLFNPHQLEAFGNVNFLKSGCVYADQVNTVSENYAKEIQSPQFGCGLDGLMTRLFQEGKLTGILNGIDYEVFDPTMDPDIPAHFSAIHIEGKAICKRDLLNELGLPILPDTPLMGIVSRLSSQKGTNLILQAAEGLFASPIQLVIQGQGEPNLMAGLKDLQERYPNHFRYVSDFNAPLAQRIYAGSDAFLMPSAFEPCGLGQMIAMRYGTVPIVRATGGLADTVFDGHNGFTFRAHTQDVLLQAVKRAKKTYQHPDLWRKLVLNGMHANHSWDASGEQYCELYQRAREAREMLAAKYA